MTPPVRPRRKQNITALLQIAVVNRFMVQDTLARVAAGPQCLAALTLGPILARKVTSTRGAVAYVGKTTGLVVVNPSDVNTISAAPGVPGVFVMAQWGRATAIAPKWFARQKDMVSDHYFATFFEQVKAIGGRLVCRPRVRSCIGIVGANAFVDAAAWAWALGHRHGREVGRRPPFRAAPRPGINVTDRLAFPWGATHNNAWVVAVPVWGPHYPLRPPQKKHAAGEPNRRSRRTLAETAKTVGKIKPAMRSDSPLRSGSESLVLTRARAVLRRSIAEAKTTARIAALFCPWWRSRRASSASPRQRWTLSVGTGPGSPAHD